MFPKSMIKLTAIFTLLFLGIIFSTSCKKDGYLTEGGSVQFSTDTLLFDTVFTAQGSSTRSIRISNPENKSILISKIRLAKGNQSPYRLNINGVPGKSFDNIELAGKDSLWVFAAVTIDPTNLDNPFLVEDRLIVSLNNQDFSIPIIAFGQNAYYIVDSVLSTQVWKNDKPYIIMKNALVDEGATLTIQAGTKVYVHQDSRLYVQGSLKINGTQSQPVTFQGDRIDRDIYVGEGGGDVPGEWGGLYFFKESFGNEINYALFKNGGASTRFFDNNVMAATIQVDEDSIKIPNQYKLRITNSTIHTSQGYGLLAFNSSVYAENCLIVECGAENVMFFEGGNYKLFNCTIATYGTTFLKHDKNVSLGVLNYFPISQSEYIGNSLNAEIKNCIIYGSLENEIIVSKKQDFLASVSIENCLLKSKDAIEDFTFLQNNKLNLDPLFTDRNELDFHLEPNSPAIGAGINLPGITTDLDGKPRPSPPSIGCFEF